MNKLKVLIPATMISLSSMAMVSGAYRNIEVPTESTQNTETVIKSMPNDKFVKNAEEKSNDLPWWGKVLVAIGGIGVLSLAHRAIHAEAEKLKNDPNAARTYLEMNGDNYLD